MRDVIYNFINEHMMIHIVLIALCIAATMGAMLVDLITGVMKAKQRGEARTSTGYKKTAVKAKKYFTPFIELCFIDLLCCVVIPFPVFSMIWTGYCIFCEFMEKPRDFDPFGQTGFAHLWLQYDCPFKVLVLGVNFILPF